ncbi:PREDICTED: ACT domain-containing protein ACR12-like [Camelina sativa]|uniref:ACT domain-containing protein ACR12-like n=1 Tax=Camelina sativa TaxID=90675 RepID=A0ABM0TB33_CAMSA|nr:PREDICTED: ACT domain-containing protein ACR12-like [Camelina sativa]
MAFSSSIVFSVTHSSSSLASRPSPAISSKQIPFPAQIASPDLSPALFDDRRKFVGGVMSLLTKSIRNRVYASINSIDATTPSYPVSNFVSVFFFFCFIAIKLLMFLGSIHLATKDLHVYTRRSSATKCGEYTDMC